MVVVVVVVAVVVVMVVVVVVVGYFDHFVAPPCDLISHLCVGRHRSLPLMKTTTSRMIQSNAGFLLLSRLLSTITQNIRRHSISHCAS